MQRSGGHAPKGVVLLLLGLFGAAHALAQPNKAQAGKPVAAPVVPLSKAALDKLRAPDANDIKVGLDEARLSGKGAVAAAPVIVELLQKGLAYGLTENALDTLGDIEWEGASPTVAWYARHRKVEIRRSAVKALVRTKGALAVKTLRAALSDEDARVRGFAATGLGSLHAKEAVADLFSALDHKVNEAAVSIGQLCTPAECEALEGRLGRIPFDVVTSGLDQVLFRPPGEVNDEAKIKVIGRIRELGTGEANRYLKDVQARWPQTWSPRVKGAIDQGIQATSGSVGSAAP
jgi:HEAT repeat protein